MSGTNAQDIVRRLGRLERLVYAYGYLLTASELERTLPALVPIMATGGVTEAEAGALLKEILQRGPTQLLVELEEMERVARAVKDAAILPSLNRMREAFLHVVRYNAPALLRRLEQSGQSTPAIMTLQKEVQAFVQGVGRTVTVPPDDFGEIFADEELLGEPAGPAEPAGNGAAAVREEPGFTRHEADVPWSDPEAATVPGPAAVPIADGAAAASSADGTSGMAAAADETAGVVAAVDGAADAAAIGWIQDRIEVINDMLQRWATSEPLAPDTSVLVRRGRLSTEACRTLYQELLEGGAVSIIDRLTHLRPSNTDERNPARALRGRIVDGVVGAVPRLLGLLSSGGQLDTEVDGVRGDPDRVLADLADYLARAADLYDLGSSLRDRLLYLAGELRAVTNL